MMASQPQLAYLGLGAMGRAMCNNLVKKGKLEKNLIIYNRTKSTSFELAERIGNCIVATSIKEAVSQADIVFSCLTNDDAVMETFADILKCDVKDKLFVNCSTTQPRTTNALAELLGAAGASLVTMPVFGEPSMAEEGKLVCVLAGAKDLVDRIRPYCIGVIGRSIIDFSDEEHSQASLLKVIGNIFIVNLIETAAEGRVMAEKTGLTLPNLQKFIDITYGVPLSVYSQRMNAGDYYGDGQAPIPISMAQHLADEVLALASTSGVKLRAYEAAVQHMKMVREHCGLEGGIYGLYGAVRKESGLKFENNE